MKFKCSGCGACCMQSGKLGIMPDRGDGGCIHLDDNNGCSIYETRPMICRVDESYEAVKGIKESMSFKEWVVLNTKSCHDLIDKEGLDPKYKVGLDEYEG